MPPGVVAASNYFFLVFLVMILDFPGFPGPNFFVFPGFPGWIVRFFRFLPRVQRVRVSAPQAKILRIFPSSVTSSSSPPQAKNVRVLGVLISNFDKFLFSWLCFFFFPGDCFFFLVFLFFSCFFQFCIFLVFLVRYEPCMPLWYFSFWSKGVRGNLGGFRKVD